MNEMELEKIVNELEITNGYQEFSKEIIDSHISVLKEFPHYGNRESLISDVIFRLEDAFGIKL